MFRAGTDARGTRTGRNEHDGAVEGPPYALAMGAMALGVIVGALLAPPPDGAAPSGSQPASDPGAAVVGE
jgi:hypothetical protein